jgi:class 3 adenylate cyclase
VVSRLALVVVLVALVSVVVTSIVGLNRGADLADAEIEDELTAVGAARADQVERYLAGLQRAVVGQALTPRPAAAIEEFATLFAELDAEPASSRDRAAVDAYYRDVVAPELADARDRPVRASTLVPVDDAAITLQARYVVPLEEGEKRPPASDDIVDTWTSLDDPLDDALREFALRIGFDDLYLIEPDDYLVVYSAAKGIDFATSLRTGPHSGSPLAALIDALASGPEVGTVAVRDFAPYAPAGDRPSGFVGSPVFTGDELVGFVVGRFAPDEMTTIMTDDERWSSFGDSGETYVVAADGRLRSDARLFVEDRAAFFEQVENAGTATEAEISSMQRFDTTVTFQPIDDRRVDAVFDDAADAAPGVEQTTNYLGREVLSVGRPVDVEGLEWAVLAEADLEEIRSPIDDFTRNLLVTIAVFIVVVTFLAVRWADRLIEPLRVMSARLRSIRSGGDIAPRTQLPGSSTTEFVELAEDIDTMLVTLRERTAGAQRRADERRRVLRRLLPASVADRAEAGDRDMVEQVPAAAVAVIVLDGLGALVTAGSPDRARGLLDRFVEEADDLAGERGLDRVQLTGDAYVAACGVSQPHLDRAARAAAFVRDVSDMLRDLDVDDELGLRVGLAVGPITVGLTGGSRLIHDTWGTTVQRATDLARSARPGEVLVSPEFASLLPSTYRLEPTNRDDESSLLDLDAASEVTT